MPYSVDQFSSVANVAGIFNSLATAIDLASTFNFTPASFSACRAVGKNVAATDS